MTPFRTVSSAQSPPSDSGQPFSSPLLHEILGGLDPDCRYVILVPGAVNPGIVAMLQGKRCRLVVADAASALSELDGQSLESDALAERVTQLILDASPERVDAILCWDLLNYMSPPLLKAFASRLVAIMSPNGKLHAYIHSASPDMPQYPQHYTLLENDQVVRLAPDPSLRKTPRYSYGDLEKHAAGLRVFRSVLLRNGMQEYLLHVSPG